LACNFLLTPYYEVWQMIKEAFGAGSVGKALARMFGPP
jgi:hypothetical protein